MKMSSISQRNSGAYTSPGTPEYRDSYGGGIQKGWSSERVVPLAAHISRRHLSTTALMPFNSGRALPSKWDDAERWITSPVSGYGACTALVAQPHRRPKSKSGPLGPPGATTYFSDYSPAAPFLEGGSGKSFMAASPFTTGVLVAQGLSVQYGGGVGAPSSHLKADNISTSRSGNLSGPGCSTFQRDSSLPSCLDETRDDIKDEENMVSRVISRRDMATQMSPLASTNSSPSRRSSISPSPPSVSHSIELFAGHSANMQVRDVQVDKGANNVTRHVLRTTKRTSPDINHLVSSWDIVNAAQNTSKIRKEEAKITAWENLQKAKAEAAIRKLEMKLEKKRSSSMDKILSKLRDAQSKAQEMRGSIPGTRSHQDSINSQRISTVRRYMKMVSLRGCFACHLH